MNKFLILIVLMVSCTKKNLLEKNDEYLKKYTNVNVGDNISKYKCNYDNKDQNFENYESIQAYKILHSKICIKSHESTDIYYDKITNVIYKTFSQFSVDDYRCDNLEGMIKYVGINKDQIIESDLVDNKHLYISYKRKINNSVITTIVICDERDNEFRIFNHYGIYHINGQNLSEKADEIPFIDLMTKRLVLLADQKGAKAGQEKLVKGIIAMSSMETLEDKKIGSDRIKKQIESIKNPKDKKYVEKFFKEASKASAWMAHYNSAIPFSKEYFEMKKYFIDLAQNFDQIASTTLSIPGYEEMEKGVDGKGFIARLGRYNELNKYARAKYFKILSNELKTEVTEENFIEKVKEVYKSDKDKELKVILNADKLEHIKAGNETFIKIATDDLTSNGRELVFQHVATLLKYKSFNRHRFLAEVINSKVPEAETSDVIDKLVATNYSPRSYAYLGYYLRGKKGNKVISTLKTGCKEGANTCCDTLCREHKVGCDDLIKMKIEDEKIKEKYRKNIKACDGGDMEACIKRAYMEDKAGNINEARKNYKKACEGKNSDGCFRLGYLESKAGNVKEARKNYKKACEGGNMKGCSNLGSLEYKAGNFAEARKNHKKACEGGNIAGCQNLGYVEVKAKNIAEARKWYRKACDHGLKESCKALDLKLLNEEKKK